VVAKLLEKDPALRYQTAAGLISDLKRLSASDSKPARRPLWKGLLGKFFFGCIIGVTIWAVMEYLLSDNEETAADHG